MILIVCAGLFVYANSLRGEFLWDDETLVQFNPYIKDWSYLPQIFTSRLGSIVKETGAFYRPVQTFTYLLDYSLWRLNVVGYHVTSTVWHILTAVSVFVLVQMIFGQGKLSLVTAVLFVIHPIHTEGVSYIAGRADSLAACFMLLSFILYLRHYQRPRGTVLVGMASCYLLALLSKEISLILPPLIFFYHYAFKKPVNKAALLTLIGTLAAYTVWRLSVVGMGATAEGFVPTFGQRLPGIFVALANYFRLLVLPFDLHMEYGGLLFPYGEPKAMMGAALLVLVLVYVFRKRNHDRFLFFSAGWFFIALLPSSNVFPINAYMAEHWLYIPSIGFFLLIARVFVRWFDQPSRRGLAVVAMTGLFVFYAGLTIRQNRYWQKGINFYKRMLYYAPHSSRLYNNLAKAYHDAGKNDELIDLLQSAIQLEPDNILAYNNLGNAYKEIGRFDDAKRAYSQAIHLDPDHAGPYYNLSIIYADIEGNIEEAERLLNKAIALSPYFSKSYNKLGLIYLQRGQTDEAIGLLSKAAQLNPDDPEIYHTFGYIYVQAGNSQKAIEMYQKAIEANPHYVQAYHDLAIIYASSGEYRKAIPYCDQAAALGYADQQLLDLLKPYR